MFYEIDFFLMNCREVFFRNIFIFSYCLNCYVYCIFIGMFVVLILVFIVLFWVILN